METTENNRLIAEFMGAKYSNYADGTIGVILPNPPSDHYPSNGVLGLKYGKSWDWLMPVVQKCYKIDNEEMFDNLVDAVSTLDIDITYNSVIEFIKSYNKNLVD